MKHQKRPKVAIKYNSYRVIYLFKDVPVPLLNPTARKSILLTQKFISQDTLDHMKSVNTSLAFHESLCVHGCPPDSVTLYLFQVSRTRLEKIFRSMKEKICFVGHTHVLESIQFDGKEITRSRLSEGLFPLEAEHQYIINAGSVGQPRDGDNRAKHVIWDTSSGHVDVRCVPYDIGKTASRILKLGFPEFNAQRLWWVIPFCNVGVIRQLRCDMRRIGKYEICGLLGKGGMAKVYKVRIPVIGKVAALKLLSPHPNLVDLLGKDEIKRLFVTEAVTMASLRHPHIVAVWDFQDSDDLSFFVMEYYCNNLGIMIGETYRVEEPSRTVAVDKAIDYTRQILVGLSRLHEAHIVHRDIKPYNILITDEDRVKISDFGLSKLRGETFQGPPNLRVGSPYYAAPEQEEDPDQVDARADIYPVAIMLYRMLTGTLPIEPFKRLSQVNADLDPNWDAFIDKAIATDRDKRFASAKEMLGSLDALSSAWEEKKEKVCQMPQMSAPKRLQSKKKLRVQAIKVAPGKARKVFGLNKLWCPINKLVRFAHNWNVGILE